MNLRNAKQLFGSALAGTIGLCAFAGSAQAANYTDTASTTYANGCAAPLIRTINVTETQPVIDLDVGLINTIQYRMDTQIDLVSPLGTRVRVLDGPAPNTIRENYNVLFDDASGTLVNTAPHDTGDNVGAAPYENIVRPNALLSGFNGENPAGNWQFEICDNFTGDGGGTLSRLELRFAAPTNGADLALSLNTSTTTPAPGSNVTLSVVVTNTPGSQTATGVSAALNLPAGFTYQSHTGPGSFNPTTGNWTVGSIPPGVTRTLNVVVQVGSGGNITSEILTSNQTDPDSTPGNGQVGEDDDASRFLVPVTTTAPTLTCSLSGAPSVLDWTSGGGAYNWPSGTLTQTYSVPGATKNVDMTVTISGDTNRLISRTLNGAATPTPVTDPQMTGGSTAGNTDGVILNVDYQSVNEGLTLTVDLGAPTIGMEKVQFPIFDVDQGTWTDRIVARGFLNGQLVNPLYTVSGSNTIGQGGVIGTGGSTNTQGLGNMWVTFNSPVDMVEFDYDNVAAQADPASQVISLENVSFCEMPEPEITGSKTVDSATAGDFMIPGNEVVYIIAVSNAATATGEADNIVLHDVLADNLRFVSATPSGFTGGTFNSPALPATNTDCTGGACEINFTGATLPVGATGQINITALVK